MEAAMMQAPMMLAVPMPMCYYWAPPHGPQEAAYPPEVTTAPPHRKESPEEEVCEDRSGEVVNHVEDEVYYQLVDSYEHPGLWRFVEEGLWVRSTTLPTLEACYVEKTAGDQCMWGSSVADFERALPRFSHGFVHFHLAEMEALQAEHEAAEAEHSRALQRAQEASRKAQQEALEKKRAASV